jgi:hypothetical protein
MTTLRIERLAELPRRLAAIVRESGEDGLDAAFDGEWNIRTGMAHLRDEESFVFRLRLERMLSEDHPTFAPYPPEQWLANRDTSRDDAQELLRDLALQRQASVNMLQRLSAFEWERPGKHPTQGAYTVSTWVDYWLKHDAEHLDAMQQVLGRVKSD